VLSNKKLLVDLAKAHKTHSRNTEFYQNSESFLLENILLTHGPISPDELLIGEIGSLKFPYFSMGNIDSAKLFGLDEIILFSLYYANRNRYKKTLDLGANIGLHTLVMKKLGFEVVSYEPDIIHLAQFDKVMKLNGFNSNGVRPKAISDKSGTMDYVRILGNTTGSHLLGSKEAVYGPTESVTVQVDDILAVLTNENFDFVKMDVEGHEAILLNRITADSINKTDIMLEIGSENNAKVKYDILKRTDIPAFAQKINWNRVEKLEDLPNHHTHGSLFLSLQGAPNWN
jgi:FkbM family methyltransferase